MLSDAIVIPRLRLANERHRRGMRGRPARGGGRSTGSVHRQVHLLEQRPVTWVHAQTTEQRVVLDKPQANVVRRKRAVEPLEGILAVAAPGMNLRDLPSGPIRLPLD